MLDRTRVRITPIDFGKVQVKIRAVTVPIFEQYDLLPRPAAFGCFRDTAKIFHGSLA